MGSFGGSDRLKEMPIPEENNKGGHRYKVAIIGEHTKEKADLDTDELPWQT